MSGQGRMIYNPNTGIYEQEENPNDYMTGSMILNRNTGVWEPRSDDPHSMYSSNYRPNASQTMSYNTNNQQWEEKQKTSNTKSATKKQTNKK